MREPSRFCQCPQRCNKLERCDLCLRELAHDYVHWNGDFYECEECSVLEGLVGYPGRGGFKVPGPPAF